MSATLAFRFNQTKSERRSNEAIDPLRKLLLTQ